MPDLAKLRRVAAGNRNDRVVVDRGVLQVLLATIDQLGSEAPVERSKS